VFPASTDDCAAHARAQFLQHCTTTGDDDCDTDMVAIRGSAPQDDDSGPGGAPRGRKATQRGAWWIFWRDLFIVVGGGGGAPFVCNEKIVLLDGNFYDPILARNSGVRHRSRRHSTPLTSVPPFSRTLEHSHSRLAHSCAPLSLKGDRQTT
jgi:hypothetical protein